MYNSFLFVHFYQRAFGRQQKQHQICVYAAQIVRCDVHAKCHNHRDNNKIAGFCTFKQQKLPFFFHS